MTSQDQIIVAVAGGTGGIEKSIVKVLSARREFQVIVLSRKVLSALCPWVAHERLLTEQRLASRCAMSP